MSQIYQSMSDGPFPPAVILAIEVDEIDDTLAGPGTVVAVANKITLRGDNGIITSVDPDGGDTATIRFQRAFLTTTDATPTSIFAFQTIDNTCVTFQVIFSAYDETVSGGLGGYTTATLLNVAGTLTFVDDTDIILNFTDPSLSTANLTLARSGTQFVIIVTGVAGHTINWSVCLPGITNTLPPSP